MRTLRWIGIPVLVLVLLVVTAVLVFDARAAKVHEVPAITVAIERTPEVIARGQHLVHTTAGCEACHGDDLGGKMFVDESPMTVAASNITSGRGSAVQGYTDADWMRAIVHGVHKDGRSLMLMPSADLVFARADYEAIIAYVTQVPPVDREFPPAKATLLGKVIFTLTNADVLSAETAKARPKREAPPAVGATKQYGAYLIDMCRGCHGQDLRGGKEAHPGAPKSADISPSAMAVWTFDELENALRRGKRRAGGDLHETMPWIVTKDLTADEMQALWLALREPM